MSQDDLPIYTPDFPTRNHMDLQRSRIPLGDTRQVNYETTYTSTHRPFTHQDVRQSLDTHALQRTHWNPGGLLGGTISESHDKYRNFGTSCKRETSRTRDMMMRTSFNLSDGSKMESRQLTTLPYIEPINIDAIREKNSATNFDLKNPQMDNRWVSTARASYRPWPVNPAESADMSIMRGYGAKSTFQTMAAFPSATTTNRSSYIDYRTRPGTAVTDDGRNRTVTIENGTVNFEQGISHKWRRTNAKFGDADSASRYRTTMKDGIQPHGLVAVDPKIAQDRKIQFSRSSVNAGNNYPSVKTTTMQDSVKIHPDFKPTESAEKTAFQSHQDFRNWNGVTYTTTNREAYQAKKAEYVPPINNHLQRSHAIVGDRSINEKTTIYQDSFKKPPASLDKIDMQSIRDFHQGHHTNSRSGQYEHTETTTNQRTYKEFKNFKPSDICPATRGGLNVIQDEPRLTVRQSAMQEAFQPHPIRPPEPIDNNLQRSHIQLQGSGEKWSTTQSDYFRFRRYRMPQAQ